MSYGTEAQPRVGHHSSGDDPTHLFHDVPGAPEAGEYGTAVCGAWARRKFGRVNPFGEYRPDHCQACIMVDLARVDLRETS